MIPISLLSSFVVLCISPLFASAASLDVKLKSGTFRGVLANGTERWLGIPYALPPVGSLRFKAPVPVASSHGIHDASTFGNACPQPPRNTVLLIDLGAPVGEDCLMLNVFRPVNTTAASALPVLVWIHGGAWTIGSASEPANDPTRIVLRSVSVNKPIVVVSINYRLNTFGFLASSLMEPQDLNAGLLDQRQALTFIQDNIATFGGDPNKVTIWGQSVGGGSVEAHLLYPAQRSFFRAGIADSATGPFKTSPPVSIYDRPGKPFARLLAATGCSAGAHAVSCLQTIPFETLLNISNAMINATLDSQLWEPAIGPSGSFATEVASARIERGDFLHLPFIGGTNANEGTVFTPSVRGLNLTGAAQDATFNNFLQQLFIDNSTISSEVAQEILQMWPANETALGPAFNTTGGDVLFDRAEAFYTDAMFLASRRLFTDKASSLQPTWAYYFDELIPGNDPTLGVWHTSELQLLLGFIPEIAAIETDFSNQFMDFYINFVNDLDPGPAWPRANSKQVLQLKRDNITMIPDTFDLAKTTFINTPKVLEEFQK